MLVPFADLKAQYLTHKNEIDSAIFNVIEDGSFIGGKYVDQFEQEFGKAYGVKNVVSCANGTDSLYIIMKMLGIGPGDEVITVSNSWISSSETITQTGAKVRFVDIDPDYFTMDETSIASAITKETKAILVVHLYGQMCNMNAIKEICDKHKLYLIEDCAQSHFSSLGNTRAGLFGIAASFSFYPGKNLGAYGDAGCIISNDDDFALKCRKYSKHGALKKHFHEMEGINSRMDGIQASILLAKLPYILDWTKKRIQVAEWYNDYLGDIPQIIIPKKRENSLHSYHLYVIKAENRTQLMSHLRALEIDTLIHYPTPLPFMEAYGYLKHQIKDFPNLATTRDHILSLPIFPEMTHDMVKFVADSIRAFYHAN